MISKKGKKEFFKTWENLWLSISLKKMQLKTASYRQFLWQNSPFFNGLRITKSYIQFKYWFGFQWKNKDIDLHPTENIHLALHHVTSYLLPSRMDMHEMKPKEIQPTLEFWSPIRLSTTITVSLSTQPPTHTHILLLCKSVFTIIVYIPSTFCPTCKNKRYITFVIHPPMMMAQCRAESTWDIYIYIYIYIYI